MNARSLGFLALAVLGVTLISVTGCTDRDNPVEGVFTSDHLPFQISSDFQALNFNPLGDTPIRGISVAWASHTPLTGEQPKFPVLYLLHDFGGTDDYFTRYNLQATMDDMYAKGEIKRMLVVTIEANNSFGGSFYRNSPSTGRYENLIGEAISFVEPLINAYTAGGAGARAISGHGMGGYGALAYAIDHPGMFGSVSSMSGSVAFDEAWLDMMMDEFFAENPGVMGDSAAFMAVGPELGKPYTNLLFGMSSAFSPRDLNPFKEIGVCRICNRPTGCTNESQLVNCSPCSVFTNVPLAKTTYQFERATGNRAPCSNPVIPPGIGVDFPFDWTGARLDSVWNLWYGSDVLTKFEANTDVFNGTPLYFDCGAQDEYGFLAQNRAFRDALVAAGKGQGTDFFYEEYSGYSALPAGHSELVGERLRKILKFHSDRFSRPPGSEPDSEE